MPLDNDLGSFVDNAAADAHVAARGWTLSDGVFYKNTTTGLMRDWVLGAWVERGGGAAPPYYVETTQTGSGLSWTVTADQAVTDADLPEWTQP